MANPVKTICIDSRMINHSGIGVYIRYYLNFLIQSMKFDIILIGNQNLIEKSIGKHAKVRFIDCDIKIYSVNELLIFPFMIPRCDIFWSPHYNAPILPIKARKNIITIPDIAHITMADKMGFSLVKKFYSRFLLFIGLMKSDLITTISEFSKYEICNYLNVSKKLKVIYLGVDISKFTFQKNNDDLSMVINKYNLPERYILFVGNVKPHKNLEKLVKAFEKILINNSDIFLVIAGKKEGFITGDSKLFKYIDQNSSLKSKVRFTGYVEQKDLPIIYKNALIFAFPSLYEGFGFPPLEAMASGCPVVASTAASIPEICGDAVLYFDPLDPKQIANSITLFLENEILRNEYIIKGLNHVKKYNWEDSGKEFLKVIETL